MFFVCVWERDQNYSFIWFLAWLCCLQMVKLWVCESFVWSCWLFPPKCMITYYFALLSSRFLTICLGLSCLVLSLEMECLRVAVSVHVCVGPCPLKALWYRPSTTQLPTHPICLILTHAYTHTSTLCLSLWSLSQSSRVVQGQDREED